MQPDGAQSLRHSVHRAGTRGNRVGRLPQLIQVKGRRERRISVAHMRYDWLPVALCVSTALVMLAVLAMFAL